MEYEQKNNLICSLALFNRSYEKQKFLFLSLNTSSHINFLLEKILNLENNFLNTSNLFFKNKKNDSNIVSNNNNNNYINNINNNEDWMNRNCEPYQYISKFKNKRKERIGKKNKEKNKDKHKIENKDIDNNLNKCEVDKLDSTNNSTIQSNTCILKNQKTQEDEKVIIFNKKQKFLQIGCNDWKICVKKNWLVLDAIASVNTHLVTNSTINLKKFFDDESVHKVYTSHTLEHFSHYASFTDSSESSEVCKVLFIYFLYFFNAIISIAIN
jgi:hypothetical protein